MYKLNEDDKDYPFPTGCTIRDIHPGKGERAGYIYASLYDKNGVLLISATLDYIYKQLKVMSEI
jgi:hypothetical protein